MFKKNKLILHIKIENYKSIFERGGAQNYVLWPRAQKCVKSGPGFVHCPIILPIDSTQP
jgi:hypothetical protein